jgi:PPM family protein phosphatase
MLRVAEHFARTDTGRQRPANEDAYFERAPLFLVADGMGGAQAGEVASRVAVEAFEPGLPDEGSVEERLAARAQEANERIHALAEADADRAGMGTTLSAVYVGEDEVTIAHVGDSRIYVLHDGELTRLTRDHSLVQEYIDRGKLTEAEAEDHPQRSIITRALGPEPNVEIDTRTYPAQPGDVFLICSDGLTSMVPEARVRDTIAGASSLREAGIRLIDAANEAGGRDNITVVLLRVEAVGVGSEAESEAESESEPEPEEQATVAGPTAPKVDEVRAAIEEHEASLPEPPPPPPAPRRRRRAFVPVLVGLCVVAILLAGAWFASRAVYFLGTDDQGIVTVYRGLPYDLPAGVRLYQRYYTSGVPAAALPERRRKKLLDHRLRSETDASDLMRQIEEGQISS